MQTFFSKTFLASYNKSFLQYRLSNMNINILIGAQMAGSSENRTTKKIDAFYTRSYI